MRCKQAVSSPGIPHTQGAPEPVHADAILLEVIDAAQQMNRIADKLLTIAQRAMKR